MLGTVDTAGLVTAGASIHSSVSVTRSSGSSRTACWGHRHRSRQSVASPARRLAGHSKRRSLFAQSRAWLIRIFGSPGPFAENGRSVSRVTARVSSPLGVSTRRSMGHSCVVASQASSLVDSFEGRPNPQMEPTRPTVLCDPVAAARGSFAPLDGRRTEDITGRKTGSGSGRPRSTGWLEAGRRSVRASSGFTTGGALWGLAIG